MNFRALQKSIRVLEKSWKSPGNFVSEKGYEPCLRTGSVICKVELWLGSCISLVTQAVRPGFRFRFSCFFFFLIQSQIAAWSLECMRQLCMRTAHGIYRS